MTPRGLAHDVLGAVVLAVLAVPGLPACQAKTHDFYAATFACDPGDDCGTTEQGSPMACYEAGPLGGAHDFCAETCDPGVDPEISGGTACLASGARFRICHPSDPMDDRADCPQGLNCLRTDILFANDGLCMDVPICKSTADCTDTRRSACASDVLKEFAAGAMTAQLPIDHLYCVTPGCKSGNQSCPTGEMCLPAVTDITSAPDICVPICGSNPRTGEQDICPPNFVCARKVYGKKSETVCIPGLLGLRCTGNYDCLLGTCDDTGDGINQCSLPCDTDDYCGTLFNTETDTFACVPIPTGDGRHCVRMNDFSGTACDDDSGCDRPGQHCYRQNSLYPQTTGECRFSCGVDGTCPSYGGIPHVCLPGGDCYPGRFGIGCTGDQECAIGPEFKCLSPGGDGGAEGGAGSPICTFPCGGDAECRSNPWIKMAGYCGAGGVCLRGNSPGETCDRNAMCATGETCVFGDAGAGICVAGKSR
jgi:hypothetical protein